MEINKKWGEDQKGADNVTCSLVKSPNIYLELTARTKIEVLMDEYRSREWLAYLVGEISEEGNFFVEDISVPPHKESYYASAEAEAFNIPERCIGVIHSHHSMGAFHSGTDQGHVDRNFATSITVARGTDAKLTFSTVCYKDTPCGKSLVLDGSVHYLQPDPEFDVEAWLKQSKVEIDKGMTKITNIAPKPVGYYNSQQYINQATKGQLKIVPETEVPRATTSMVSLQDVTEMQESIKANRGIDLNRSEVEDALLNLGEAVPPPGWSI